MTDLADSLNQLSAYFGSGSDWNLRGLVTAPDLAGFQKQDTRMPLFPVAYVKQSGCADYGFSGQIYLPTSYPDGGGRVLHLLVDFSGY